MKQFTLLFFFGFFGIYSNAQRSGIPVLELHTSVNHLVSIDPQEYTFYGGGFGANVVFLDTRLFSIKTGIEINHFHTWNRTVHAIKETYKTNVHYNYWDFSIPLMFRLNVGKKVRFFAEAGGYVGFPLGGNVSSTDITYNPPGVYDGKYAGVIMKQESYKGFLSLSAAGSLGGIFPVSKQADLILKPEFVFRTGLNTPIHFGNVYDVNEQFFYVRLCLGIRINLNQETE